MSSSQTICNINNQEEFEEYIHNVISKVISETWQIEDIELEILVSRNSLRSLEKTLKSSKYSFTSKSVDIFFVFEETQVRWTIKKEILKVFFNCLNSRGELALESLTNSLVMTEPRCDKIYLCKIVDLLSVYGDYDFQILLFKLIMGIFEQDTIPVEDLFPESEELQDKYVNIDADDFSSTIRDFLNTLNRKSQKIFSIRCRSITLGSIIWTDENNGLWLDFNLIDRIASWYAKSTEGAYLQGYNDFSNLILFFDRNVESISVERNLCKSVVITFRLQKPCMSYYTEYQPVIENEKILKILLDYSEDAEYLVDNILPMVYGNTLHFNKKNPSNLNTFEAKRVLRSTDINTIGHLSGSSTNLPDSEFIDISSAKDLFNSKEIKRTDIDDVEIRFNSQEQLLKMAEDFNSFKTICDNFTSVNQEKNTIEETSKVEINSSKTNRSEIPALKTTVKTIQPKNLRKDISNIENLNEPSLPTRSSRNNVKRNKENDISETISYVPPKKQRKNKKQKSSKTDKSEKKFEKKNKKISERNCEITPGLRTPTGKFSCFANSHKKFIEKLNKIKANYADVSIFDLTMRRRDETSISDDGSHLVDLNSSDRSETPPPDLVEQGEVMPIPLPVEPISMPSVSEPKSVKLISKPSLPKTRECSKCRSPPWITSGFVCGVEKTLCSHSFIGKYLFVVVYTFDISSKPALLSELNKFNESYEKFMDLETNVLFCTKAPAISIRDWINQFADSTIINQLKFPVVVDFEGRFMNKIFQVHSDTQSLKTVAILNEKNKLVYKNVSIDFSEVDVEGSLKFLRRIHPKFRD